MSYMGTNANKLMLLATLDVRHSMSQLVCQSVTLHKYLKDYWKTFHYILKTFETRVQMFTDDDF